MSNKRFQYFLIFSTILFTIFLYQLYSLQIRQVEFSSEKIANQSTQSYYFPSPRGDIYDREGVILAKTSTVPKLYLDTT